MIPGQSVLFDEAQFRPMRQRHDQVLDTNICTCGRSVAELKQAGIELFVPLDGVQHEEWLLCAECLEEYEHGW
jgi:hypothetical protein